MKRTFLGLLTSLLLGTAPIIDTNAAGVITTCDEPSLLSALQGGGLVTFEAGGTIYLTNTITISSDTVLDGNGLDVSISGGGSNRVFHVNTNVHFTLKGITVIDGFSTNGGGLYNAGGIINITNCTFSGNRVLGNDGRDLVMDPNYQAATPGETASGGAIFNAGLLSIQHSTFEGNYAMGGTGGTAALNIATPASGGKGLGGALMNLGTASITDSLIRSNIAQGGLGGRGSDSSFGRTAGKGGRAAGGAIHTASLLTLSNCVFESNAAMGGLGRDTVGDGGDSSGGAIHNAGGIVRSVASEFISNRSTGGGLHGISAVVYRSRGIGYGGAYFNGDNGSTEIIGCSFRSNLGEGLLGLGGAGFNASGDLSITDTTLSSNRVLSQIFWSYNDLAIEGGSYEPREYGNGATARGGALYNADRLILNDSVMNENTAEGGFGTVRLHFGSEPIRHAGGDAYGGGLFNIGQADVSNCSIWNNAAIGGPGNAYQGVRADNGKAFGGGIANSGILVVYDNLIINNRAKGSTEGGGAGIFSTNDSQFSGNSVASNVLELERHLVVAGSFLTNSDVFFLVSGEGLQETGYNWYSFETNQIVGVTNRSYVLANLQSNDAGLYRVAFEDNTGGIRSLSASIAPAISASSSNQTKFAGQTATFSITAQGTPLYYQWYFNSVPILNATNSNYTVTVNLTNLGTYSVVVSNFAGTISTSAMLTMPPIITLAPQTQFGAPGESFRFQAGAGGSPPLFYQWQFEGKDILDGSNSTLLITQARGVDQGTYSLIVSNSYGSVTNAAELSLFNLIHWQNINGISAIWRFKGTNFVDSITLHNLPPGSAEWRMIGVNDFNNDHQVDFLWRHTNGALAVWFMNQTNRIGLSLLLRNGVPVPTTWRFVGFGDFNKDLTKDILWHSSDRRLAATLLNGTNFLESPLIRNGQTTGLGWRPMLSHDFNSDGSSDILFQHDDGRLAWWQMDGTNFVNSIVLRAGKSAGLGWRVAGLSDFNDDENKDILFRNADGRLAVWLMNQTDFLGAALLRNGPSDSWRIVGVR